MSISIFMESYHESMGIQRRQTLLVPHRGDVLVYTRVTDGTKGPHNKWLDSTLEELMRAVSDGDEHLTAEPVGIAVTLADTRAIDDKGYSPVLGTKAVMAHDKAGAATNPNALERLCELYELVQCDSIDLESFIIDNRRTVEPTPVVIKQHPAVVETPAPVTIVQVEPEPEPVPVVTQAQAAPVLQVNLATVPRQELADSYVHRQLHNIDDFAVFDYARAHHLNTLIYGPTGPGKTRVIEAWAAARKLRMVTVSGNAALEPGHLFGKYVSDGQGGFAWIDGPVTDVVRNGGVINLDEFTFISPKIYTILYSLMDSRRMIILLDHHGETIEAHPDVTIFATYNPGYIGTTPMNAAMRNRFDIQIPWDYDNNVESKLVKSKALLNVAQRLRDEAAKGQYETPISTNMLIEFESLVPGLSYEFAVENFIAHFADDEQASVRLVFQAAEHNIKSDFGIDMDIVLDTEPAAGTTETITLVPESNIPSTAPAMPTITVTI